MPEKNLYSFKASIHYSSFNELHNFDLEFRQFIHGVRFKIQNIGINGEKF